MTFCYPLVEAGGLDRGSLFAIIRWVLRSSPKLQRRKLEVKERICNLSQIAHVQTSFLLLPFKNLVFSSTFTMPPPTPSASPCLPPPPHLGPNLFLFFRIAQCHLLQEAVWNFQLNLISPSLNFHGMSLISLIVHFNFYIVLYFF